MADNKKNFQKTAPMGAMAPDVRKTEAKKENRKPEPSVTYGIYGLTEWEAVIPIGRATVRVRFAGGSRSAYGVIPATFTTANPAVKRVIENSRYFLDGRIEIV